VAVLEEEDDAMEEDQAVVLPKSQKTQSLKMRRILRLSLLYRLEDTNLSYSTQFLRQAMARVSYSAVPWPPHCRFECVTSVSKQRHAPKIY